MEFRNGKIYFEMHELAFSRRTSGVGQWFVDGEGKSIEEFYSQKKALRVDIPTGAKYLVRRYFTGSGYPQHEVILCRTGETVATVDSQGIAGAEALPAALVALLEDDIY